MPLSHACLLILIAAAGGWALASCLVYFLFEPGKSRNILGIKVWGLLPSLQHNLANELAAYLATKYLEPGLVTTHLNNETFLNQLHPEIEKHVDNFLVQKLPETFPLLSKLMGEKTLSKFKVAFLTEVELIFPELVSSYAGKMLQGLQPQVLIEREISSVSMPLIQQMLLKKAAPYIFKWKLFGAIFGALIAVLQWLLISFAL